MTSSHYKRFEKAIHRKIKFLIKNKTEKYQNEP